MEPPPRTSAATGVEKPYHEVRGDAAVEVPWWRSCVAGAGVTESRNAEARLMYGRNGVDLAASHIRRMSQSPEKPTGYGTMVSPHWRLHAPPSSSLAAAAGKVATAPPVSRKKRRTR